MLRCTGICVCVCPCADSAYMQGRTPKHTCAGQQTAQLLTHACVCVCACVFACSFCTFINIHIHTHTRIYRDHWNRVQRRQSPRHLAHVPFASAAPQSIRFQHKRTIQGGLSGECECVSVNECVHRIALNTQYCCRL
jgi:hypothetical protein